MAHQTRNQAPQDVYPFEVRNILNIMQEAQPIRKITGIYFLIMNEEIVYVGQSVNILQRVGSHISEGKKFNKFSFVECNESQLRVIESVYIKMIQPMLNSIKQRRKSR